MRSVAAATGCSAWVPLRARPSCRRLERAVRAGRRAGGDSARAGARGAAAVRAARFQLRGGRHAIEVHLLDAVMYHVSVLRASCRAKPSPTRAAGGAPLRRGRRHAAPRPLGRCRSSPRRCNTDDAARDGAPPPPLPQLLELCRRAVGRRASMGPLSEETTRRNCRRDDCRGRGAARASHAHLGAIRALCAAGGGEAAAAAAISDLMTTPPTLSTRPPSRRRSARRSRPAPPARASDRAAARRRAARRDAGPRPRARPRPQSGATDAVRADAARAGDVDRILAERIRST